MTQAEIRLIESGWDVLVEQLGLAEATRFVMLLDRRTGGALQHLQHLWSGAVSTAPGRTTAADQEPAHQFDSQ